MSQQQERSVLSARYALRHKPSGLFVKVCKTKLIEQEGASLFKSEADAHKFALYTAGPSRFNIEDIEVVELCKNSQHPSFSKR